MTAFTEYYVPEVCHWLERFVQDKELESVKKKYIAGWHPRRTAKYLQILERIETVREELEKLFEE